MRAARIAALRAPSIETQATGTPGGICTIESSASSPSATLLLDRNGTPITGSSEYDATTPGKAAAIPAPQMITRTPRSAAVEAYSATPLGSRCADRTWSSCEMPRSSSSCNAGSIDTRSDSEPTRIPTSGPGSPNSSSSAKGSVSVSDNVHRASRDVAAEAHSGERDQVAGCIGTLSRLVQGGCERGHVEHASAVRQEPPLSHRRARVEDERPGRLCRFDALDRRACVGPLRVVPSGEDDGHCGVLGRLERARGKSPACRGGEGLDEIPLDAREDRLRLRIPEPAVELQHLGAGVGQHQASVKQADEWRSALRKLGHDRPVHSLDQVLDSPRIDVGDG